MGTNACTATRKPVPIPAAFLLTVELAAAAATVEVAAAIAAAVVVPYLVCSKYKQTGLQWPPHRQLTTKGESLRVCS